MEKTAAQEAYIQHLQKIASNHQLRAMKAVINRYIQKVPAEHIGDALLGRIRNPERYLPMPTDLKFTHPKTFEQVKNWIRWHTPGELETLVGQVAKGPKL